jgi:hypothetical protein
MELTHLAVLQSDGYRQPHEAPTAVYAVGNYAQSITRYLGSYQNTQLEFARRFDMQVLSSGELGVNYFLYLRLETVDMNAPDYNPFPTGSRVDVWWPATGNDMSHE